MLLMPFNIIHSRAKVLICFSSGLFLIFFCLLVLRGPRAPRTPKAPVAQILYVQMLNIFLEYWMHYKAQLYMWSVGHVTNPMLIFLPVFTPVSKPLVLLNRALMPVLPRCCLGLWGPFKLYPQALTLETLTCTGRKLD